MLGHLPCKLPDDMTKRLEVMKNGLAKDFPGKIIDVREVFETMMTLPCFIGGFPPKWDRPLRRFHFHLRRRKHTLLHETQLHKGIYAR
jgi:hypothetical protein